LEIECGPGTNFMSADTGFGFVDTNVLVYALERAESPKKRIAERLLAGLMEEDRFRSSTQVLQELFVTLTRKVAQPCSIDQAAAILDDLTVWPLFVVDYAAIRSAIALSAQVRISFWDALIVVSADRCGASVLYSEDLNAGQEILRVRIVNPFLPS
jgi:predicted nucleic acid-binding protein